MSLEKLPRWFQDNTRAAGALDDVGERTGLTGWIFDHERGDCGLRLEVRSGSETLAQGETNILRPDLSEALGRTTHCGFNIAWTAFDLDAVRRRLAEDADAQFDVVLPDLGVRLQKFSSAYDIESISLKAIAGYMSGDSRASRADAAFLPRWFDGDAGIAGAVDKIDATTGLSGWVLDRDRVDQRWRLEVTSGPELLARGEANIPRSDLGEVLGITTHCGFNIAWSAFDLAAVQRRLAEAPDATFDVVAPDLGARLRPVASGLDLSAVNLKELSYYLGMEASAICHFVDPIFYRKHTPDIPPDVDVVKHYLEHGEAQGRRPNPFFDPKWYARKYMAQNGSSGALEHFLAVGELQGHRPCPLFDALWYRNAYQLAEGSALGHYLRHKRGNLHNPNRYFDAAYYRDRYPDIAEANADAFDHWLNWGMAEGRRASPHFDADYVRRRYLGGNRALNPLEIFMDLGEDLGWEATPSAADSVHRLIAANCAAGPEFELQGPPVPTLPNRPRIFAFYLPQFHAIPENDLWWGNGFTEWRNLPRGVPRFAGHVQPRVPRDLGFYDLTGATTLRRQIELARHGGIHGFCFYYYNFNGQRLLEGPLDSFLAEPDLDFPFCIMWANENWSRRWDGSDENVLVHQDYRDADLPALVDDFARHMRDPRYLKSADGRPFLFIYRADIIPRAAHTVAAWRAQFRDVHDLDPIFVMAQTFGADDPRQFQFDAAIEFPPHKLGAKLPDLRGAFTVLDPEFSGTIRDYNGVVEESLACCHEPYPLIKTAFPSWDNDARRQGRGLTFANSSPKAFENWMAALIANAESEKIFGEKLVFVNAWNEWCEGAYLEPDTHYGYAYLNAVGRALRPSASRLARLVLVGHDAFPAGAQHLLLNVAATLVRVFGVEVEFVLLKSGALVSEYRRLAPTFVAEVESWQSLRQKFFDFRARGFRNAITNSTVSGAVSAVLEELGYNFISLVHELPTLIESYDLAEAYRDICDRAHCVVYPSAFVKAELDRAFGAASKPTVIRPQGLYNAPRIARGERADVRRELGLPTDARIVINLGYADLRKGVDLFIGLAAHTLPLDPDTCFVWLGDVHPDIEPWVHHDLQRRRLTNLRFLPFDKDVGRCLSAADLFVLTSREDPFPSVVIEALAVGLRVLAFENSGGHTELLKTDVRLGELLPANDVAAAAARILAVLDDGESDSLIAHRQKVVAEQFDFRDYCADLLRTLQPGYPTVSVIVPNYNYARHLRERLLSIFEQTHPVFEIIVLDDASADDSVAVARAVAESAGRSLRIVERAVNSGNVFRQWYAGLEMARGDFVWIAEADDSADPNFLAEAVKALKGDPAPSFCFTDSCAIDAEGATIYNDYKGYYREFGDDGLDRDGDFDSADFLRRFLAVRNHVLNASSVLWRSALLRRVFDNLGEEAFAYRCAGDWRIYVEACRLSPRVHYIAEPLNRHRRHDKSVTGMIDARAHYHEVERVQSAALSALDDDADLRGEVETWMGSLRDHWRLDSEDEAETTG